MTSIKGPAPNPCESCPYRRDVPSGVWSKNEYEKLRDYDEPTPFQPQGIFQCHQTDRDNPQGRLCAGWVGCHGAELLSLRLGVAFGNVDQSVLDYHTSVPLWGSGAEAAEHGERDIDDPSDEACALVEKICNKRDDIQYG